MSSCSVVMCLGLDALAEAGLHAGDVDRLGRGLFGHVAGRLARLDDVERQLSRLLAQLLELVLARGGVEEVGRHRGVHGQAGQVDAQREERAHRLLHVVADHRLAEHRVELLDHRRRRPGGRPAPRRRLPPRRPRSPPGPGRPARCARGRRSSGRPAPARPVPSVPSALVTSLAVVGRATSPSSMAGTAGSAIGATGAAASHAALGRFTQRAGVEQLLHALPDRLHLVAVERLLRRRAVPAPQRELVDRDSPGARRAPAG